MNQKGAKKPQSQSITPVLAMPIVLRELQQDPEYSIWDFAEFETRPSDSAGYSVYFIPPKDEFLKGWNILTIGVQGNEVFRKYVMSYPMADFVDMDNYIQNQCNIGGSIYIEFLSYNFETLFLAGEFNTQTQTFNVLCGGGRDGHSYQGGIIQYDSFGNRIGIDYQPLINLPKWEDFNDCEIAYMIAGGIVSAGLTLAGLASGTILVARIGIKAANLYFWRKIRTEVCH